MPPILVLCSALTILAPAERTFALRWPVTPGQEPVLTSRLPVWDQTGAFDRYAVPANPPSTGADPDYDAAVLGRLAELVGPERLVAVSPTVGTAGWETSNNPAYLPLGGRPLVVATPRQEWLERLATLPVGGVALWYTQPLREPTTREFGHYLEAFLAACRGAGRQAGLWLPARWWAESRPRPLTRELTAERLEAVGEVVLVDFVGAVEAVRKAQSARREEPAEGDALAALAARAVAMSTLLSRARDRLGSDRLAVELLDEPRDYARDSDALREHVALLQAAGVARYVVRGRPDTLQAGPWQDLVRDWGRQP